jgi:organic hydroperoxide reductase OsmC/OhrA
VPVRAKEFRYAVDLTEGGGLRSEDGTPLGDTPEWTPEHLVLAALIRCVLKSLAYHAKRAGIELAGASGSARGCVTKPDAAAAYSIVETDVDLSVRLEPAPGAEERAELLAKAERDCFVGASLRVKPTYRWTVH